MATSNKLFSDSSLCISPCAILFVLIFFSYHINTESIPLSSTSKIYDKDEGFSINMGQSFLAPKSVRDIVVVNPDGFGHFTTITEAVDAAPINGDINDGYFVIYIVPGVYEEYITIAKNKKYVMMIGAGINQTVITGDRNHEDGWSTFASATFIVDGDGFVGKGITFRNTAGPDKGQAVAVRTGGDLTTFYKCSFEAYQDTLYTHSQRQFFRECDVYGTVDFIFGNAAVVFQNCNIYARQPRQGQGNMVTAQSKEDTNQNTGTSFQKCNILATWDLDSSSFPVKTFLGRPWRAYATVVYMQSFMDRLIDSAGWDPWTSEHLNTLYYAEYNNNGAGSNTSNRVTWPGYHVIDATDAARFTVYNLLIRDNNWLDATKVPYESGLI